MKNITCFIPFQSEEQVQATVANLKAQELVADIHFLHGDIRSTANVREIAAKANTEYTLIYTKYTTLSFVLFALERMEALIEDTQAAMVYADHFNQVGEVRTNAPVIDYQLGSVRDDFEFGSVLFYRTSAIKEAVARMDVDYQFAGLYDLRLKVSQKGALEHINEYLYYDVELDNRTTGEKNFDYVDPKNRGVQIEMEQAVTQHLKDINGYLVPGFKDIDLQGGGFEYEASVIIPCKNRVRTIGTAIKSALSQVVKAPYKFNVIVVDDNSEDGSVDVIKSIVAEGHDNLVYIAQDKTWHAIGGNWNVALHHEKCGRFAIQLDSDDTYFDENTVQKFIDAFHEQNCAMVVGTYQLTDFDGNMIPPGVIDHKEWTPDNGRNNALRIHGLGAPRGFYTPMLRTINFPFKFPEVGPKELRANILYAGLCHSDVLTVRELWGKTTFPIAPGHEIIAEVSQVGSEVTDYKKGDLVGFGTMRDCCEECAHCKEGREEICTAKGEHFTYGKYWGGYATAIQQPAAFFFHLPEKFDLARGAPLFCAGITTYFPMEKYLKPGMKAGVVGIGGLGHVAVKFLKKLGHEVTAFSSSPNKVQSIKDLGVDNVIISTDDEAMKAAEGTIDFMINTLPIKDGFDKYFKTMASGGYFVQVGLPPHEDMNLSFPCALLVIKEITIVGSCVGPRPVIKKMLPLCVEKDIYPIVEEFPFEDFPKAFDKLENGRPHFRCVVNVKDYAEKNGFKK